MTTRTPSHGRTRLPDHNVHGPAVDTTLFLLHGAYGSKEYWLPLIDDVTRAGYRVVAWDAPGYGISPLPSDPSIETYAQAALDLIDAVGTGRNVVLGHSMGGLVAQRIQRLAPHRTDGLILSATVHTYNHSGPEWQEEFQRTRVAPLTQGRPISDYAPELLRSMMGPGAHGPAVDLVLQTVRRMNSEHFLAAMRAVAQYDDPDVLPGIVVPTLLLAGSLDTTCPPHVMSRMAAAIPDARYVELPDCGHFGWAEAPASYARHVIDHLDRIVDPTRP
ncbi:MAG: alpha/beta hydrolase [Nocardia sp.]|uniref:alpha/beta fold hydrolase n=1 Tax=Nocardia sp. TaxID=1821 RepID=UPI002602B3CB|nr:alpha/beta fold hydrolase [Nocardia sp.]MCU1644973.1 alpha/beta hydrolase [Nocardia sp.]